MSAVKVSIQSVSRKFSVAAWLKFKGNVPALAETAFTVTAVYVGSIENDLYISIAHLDRFSDTDLIEPIVFYQVKLD